MKKILVIQQKMIGDVLVSSILCNNLRKAYPTAQIDYMVYASTVDVLQGNNAIDNLVLFTPKLRKSRWQFYKFIKELDKNNYDIVIDAYSKLESWFTIFFLNAAQKISFKKKGRTFLYTHNIDLLETPKTTVGLIIERRLSLLKPLKLLIKMDPYPKLFVSNDEVVTAKKLFKNHGVDTQKKTVMMSIIGSSENKTLPLSEMSRVVDFVADRMDVNILFNYFPKQLKQAQQIFDGCKESSRNKIYFDLFGNSLREFIAIMNQCDMIIGNDGGAINMAKALNKPSFIIFSPWIEKKMWATFEDGKFHKSVHLNDYEPVLFKEKSNKQLKRESLLLYQSFKLDMFKNSLKAFLEERKEKRDLVDNIAFERLSFNQPKLTILAITYNEIDNIGALIKNISFADEIIIVDSFSTDGTVEAVKKYANVKLYQHEFENFSDQRNFAISQSTNNWVLFLDADERISSDAQNEIKEAISNADPTTAFGFFRKSFIDGKELKFGGYQSDKVYRLFHKEHTLYDTNKLVHETLSISGKSQLLKNKISHYSYINKKDYKAKLTRYGKLRAEELHLKNVKPFFYHFYLKPAYRFFHLYIIRFGFLDGKQGIKMAKLSTFGVRQRYVALRKMNLLKK